MTWLCVTPLRFMVFSLVLLVPFHLGCSEKSASIVTEFHSSDTFTDDAGEWSLVQESLSPADNNRIERFFEKNSDLLGSPDWTGRPSKYLLGTNKSRVRYYWFTGGVEQLTWNALEFQGNSVKQLNGTGMPGS